MTGFAHFHLLKTHITFFSVLKKLLTQFPTVNKYTSFRSTPYTFSALRRFKLFYTITQKVCINSPLSQPTDCFSGTPQRSVLSSIPFSLFTKRTSHLQLNMPNFAFLQTTLHTTSVLIVLIKFSVLVSVLVFSLYSSFYSVLVLCDFFVSVLVQFQFHIFQLFFVLVLHFSVFFQFSVLLFSSFWFMQKFKIEQKYRIIATKFDSRRNMYYCTIRGEI